MVRFYFYFLGGRGWPNFETKPKSDDDDDDDDDAGGGGDDVKNLHCVVFVKKAHGSKTCSRSFHSQNCQVQGVETCDRRPSPRNNQPY